MWHCSSDVDATRELKYKGFAKEFAYHAMSTTFVGADRAQCTCVTVGNAGLWELLEITEEI